MKKISLLLIAILFAFEANAQVRWGLEGGVNVSFPSNTNSTKTGWNIGVIGEYGLNNSLFVESALKLTSKPFLSTNTWKLNPLPYTDWEEGIGLGWTGTPYYLNLPLRIGYKMNLNNTSLSFAAGPYVGVGLFGSGEHSYQYLKKGEKEYRLTPGPSGINLFGTDVLNRYETGVSLRLGAEFLKHYRLSAEYNLQLNKMMKNQPIKEHHQTLSVNLGYMF